MKIFSFNELLVSHIFTKNRKLIRRAILTNIDISMEDYAKEVVSEFPHQLQKEAQFLKRGIRFRRQSYYLFWNTFKRLLYKQDKAM